MPNNDKYKWTVGGDSDKGEPIIINDGNQDNITFGEADDLPEELQLDGLDGGDSIPFENGSGNTSGFESHETSSTNRGGNPTSNGYNPYDGQGGGSTTEGHSSNETSSHSSSSSSNRSHQEPRSPKGGSSLDKGDQLEKGNDGSPTSNEPQGKSNVPGQGYNPNGAPQEGEQAPGQGPASENASPQGNKGGGEEAPKESQGPSNDPYDDKLGKPGENGPGGENASGDAAPKDNGVPNQPANGQQPGGEGQPSGLDKKDGLGDKPDGLNKGQEPDNGAPKGKGEQGKGQGPDNGGKPGSNGYGANKGAGQKGSGDPTSNARKNLEHQNRANTGRNPASNGGATGGGGGLGKKDGIGSKGGIGESPIGKAFNGLKNRLTGNKGGGNTPSKVSGDGEGKESSSSSGFVNIMKKAASFLAKHPYAAGIIIIILIIFLICIETEVVEKSSNGGSSSSSCTYNLKGVTSSGNINLDSLQVELVNCDASEEDYTVIETVDFEKYVIGVALAEVSWHADYPAYFQAQIVAARGFALTRNSGMCPSHPDDCFYGYNASTGKIRLRNCSNDQNYCDYDKPCYRKTRGEGEKALVGLEAEGQEGAYVWKGQLDDGTKAQILSAAQEVRGKVLTDTSGNVVKTGYVNTDQENWWALAQQGKNYEEILMEHYAGSNASGMSTATCSNYGNIDYGDYVLDSSDDEILHVPLDQFLSDHGTSLESFAGLISSNVNKAGYGTRAGVVAAAVTLIAELGNNYNVKVPYYWGGGHYDGIVDGVLGYWGSTQCHTYANGQSYNYCGFDCSGFVPWAIKNGGFNIPHMLAGNFQGLSGAQRVSLSSSSPVLLPGDLLESQHHIVLVVGVDEENHQYICAEASGNARGVLFTRRSYADSGYWGVKMDGYYNTHQRSNG